MNNKREIPASLRNLQNEKRNNTISKIVEAIDLIKQDGGIVTKKKLLELTGLSSATLSKQHVIEVLKEKGVCQFKQLGQVQSKSNDKSNLSEILLKKIEKIEKENSILRSKLQDKDIVLDTQKKEHELLKENYQLILGKLHLLMKRIDIHGIDIGFSLDEL